MITVAEMRRIREAATELAYASEEYAIERFAVCNKDAADKQRERRRVAQDALRDALDAVTDWSTAPAPAGKDG